VRPRMAVVLSFPDPWRTVLFGILTLFALAGGVCTWLAYPTSSMSADFAHNMCDGDPKLTAALLGSVILAGLVVLEFFTARPSRQRPIIVLTILTILAALTAPTVTIAAGGFGMPV
jgi:hypothetical protein